MNVGESPSRRTTFGVLTSGHGAGPHPRPVVTSARRARVGTRARSGRRRYSDGLPPRARAEALEQTHALVLSEKPLTQDGAQLRAFENQHAEGMGRLRVVNHFAFSPEIQWAARLVEAEGWGTPERVLSDFNDPYILKTPEQRASYVSPWVDSGSNQISMLSRLCRGWTVRSQQVDASGLRSVTDLDFAGGRATLVANWWTGDSSKQTTLRWPTGPEVHLDHTAMTGFAVVGGSVVHHVGHEGTTARKAAHYTAMYRALLAGLDGDLLDVDLARSVAEILEAGVAAAAR